MDLTKQWNTKPKQQSIIFEKQYKLLVKSWQIEKVWIYESGIKNSDACVYFL